MVRPRFTLHPARRAEDLRAVADLFRRYAASLPVDLGYQDFAAELEGLPGRYAPPGGTLLLARGGARQPLGCVALRPMEEPGCAEMKRLFLLPEARGLGLGAALAQAAIAAARQIGYREIRLDTLPGMAEALGLYARLGFQPIPPYYAPTPPGTVFLRLTL
ncbi:GNAT family N-acetyltransferase [Roseomonas sp. GC11]|uniref:GNAT family N-acetyltransferase n=1 Tax=Roseomonas sp. GC11 TaxID=2950546 RepID=UPI00210E2379|nr:GNAT family N-acetyltransferase [Roseomonas sp. GC11]MCQ4162319.1 GNAT family N-acetyltransferase [Roseomonas sp. GC11]